MEVITNKKEMSVDETDIWFSFLPGGDFNGIRTG